jgi:hypothetical protein
MTIADVSAGYQYAVGTHLQCFENETGRDPTGTHDPDNRHVGWILKTAYTRKIRSRVSTPVAAKSNNFGFKFGITHCI